MSRFEIGLVRFLDPDGKPVAPLPDFAKDPATLIPLYRAMVRLRVLDARAIALQRTGKLGTYASSLGQEAVSVGVGSAMAAEDVLLPAFREQGAMLWRGVKPLSILLYWGGDERGNVFEGPACGGAHPPSCGGAHPPSQDFPICVPVSSQAPHAAGVALAFKLRGEKRAAVCVLGDGGTSKGDFYEALNFAGAWRLPAVFVINNNQWAISVRRSAQSAAATLAQKAIAAGLPGLQVDGNDVVAVHEAVRGALARARAGEGACLIEALTYRLGDHTTADDARHYRDDSEVSPHWREEPILRLRRYLTAAHGWSKEDEERLLSQCAAEIEETVAAYETLPPQAPTAMFDSLYATLPAGLEPQRRMVEGENG